MACLCLGAVTAGCAHTPPPAPPPIRGSVNLDQLMRRHPGWSSVSQYDAAVRRLEQAAGSFPKAFSQGMRPDQTMTVLLALPPTAAGRAAPPEVVSRTDQRLSAVQQSLLDGLQSRREAARLDAVRQQQDVWRREARSRFSLPPEVANSLPDLQLQLLQANVTTLTRTEANWKASVPPAPRLAELQAKVALEQARLASLLTERARQRTAAQAQRQEARQRVRADRAAYVQAQADALTAKIRADDAEVVAAQSARLTEQRSALLADLARSPPAAVISSFGSIGAVALPHGPQVARAGLSQAGLAASEAHLRAQRARWVQFIRDDTQAAAQDTAAKHGWDITFGSPRPGDRDLTTEMTQALASSVWRL